MAFRALKFLSQHPGRGTLISRFCTAAASSSTKPLSVCIVGSGPAGFYTAQHLLRGPDHLEIDIIEKFPVPFGLVRFGVAPDHPEVKNVDNTFTKIAKNGKVRFRGNVSVGEGADVSIRQLRNIYDVVVLAYGAAKDKEMGIPGETLPEVVSARAFVDFYNGLPTAALKQVDLTGHDSAVVVGLGNVALDVARILLTPIDMLRTTDITEEALQTLAESRVERVYVVGRRGPLHVAFTIKELREMVNLQGCTPIFNPNDFTGVKEIISSLGRPRKRLTELLAKTALDPPTPKQKQLRAQGDREWILKLLRTPVEVHGDAHVTGITLGINRLIGDSLTEAQSVEATVDSETLECGYVFRSIGYMSTPIDSTVPFDTKKGVVKHEAGRVADSPALYVSGWLATGPRGVIVDTMTEAHRVGHAILEDIEKGVISASGNGGREGLTSLLRSRGVQEVSFEDWERIDAAERSQGEKIGKPRVKITQHEQFMSILQKQ